MKHIKLFEQFLNEGKSFEFSFNYNTDEDDVEYVQNILHDAGVDAIAEPGIDSEEMMVKAKNAVELRKAKKAIQADGFEVNESLNEEITLNSPSFKKLVIYLQKISDENGNDWKDLVTKLKSKYAMLDTYTSGTNPAAYVVNFFSITKGKDASVKKKPSDYVEIGEWYVRPW